MVLRRFAVLALAAAAFLLTAASSWAGPPPPTIDVQPQGTGSGGVTGTTFGGVNFLNCTWNGTVRSGDCNETFAVTTAVQVTATPAPGSVFDGWEGADGCPGITSGTDGQVCTFAANPADPVVLRPEFVPDVSAGLTVAPQGPGTGTVTGSVPGPPPDINCTWNGATASGTCDVDIAMFPTTIELTATAAGGSTFPGWTAATCPGGTISGTGDTICTITIDDPSDAVTVQPSFQGPDTVATLTVAPQGSGEGTVTGTGPTGAVINCAWNGTTATGDCTEEVAIGQGGQFTLVATPDAGSSVTWTNCPGSVSPDGRTCTLTIDDPADDFTVRPAFSQTPGPPGCTIVGTEGDDDLVGTSSRDVICGLGGDDTIRGLGGNDLLLGGNGDDRMIGGSGGDQLNGASGADRLEGGAGTDRSSGGTGNDRVIGGAGSDSMSGGTGSDRLFGNAGSDVASGGAGADWLYGGAGSDVLSGGAGFDRAFGNAGADLCSAERRSSC